MGELDLYVFRCIAQALHGVDIVFEVDTLLLLKLINKVIRDKFVEIVTAEVIITRGGFDLEHAFASRQDGDIERAPAEIIDKDRNVLFLVNAVCKGTRGWFVDDAQDFKAGNLSGILCGLPLSIIKIPRSGDNRFCYFFSKIGLRIDLKFLEDHRGNFLGGVLLLPIFTFSDVPIFRLMDWIVRRGLATAWRFARLPTRRSPSLVNATTDGVVRAPSLLGITMGLPASIIDMQEKVVPRSIPRIFSFAI